MRKMKKVIAEIMCAAMFTAILGGCGQAAETKEPAADIAAEEAVNETEDSGNTDPVNTAVPSWQQEIDWEKIGWQPDPEDLEWKQKTDPVTLDYYANFAWFSLDWNDKTSARVTEKTGVNLNFSKPVTDDGQKMNMMIAGNQLPDIMTVDKNDAALQTMIEAGMLWSMDELMDQYAPRMRELLPKEAMTDYRAADGKTYQITTWIKGEAWQKAAREYDQLIGTNQAVVSIRSDYYDEVGRPEIKTMEDFMEVLSMIKEKHPDKIGFYPSDESMAAATFGKNAELGFYGRQVGLSTNYSVKDGEVKWVVRDDAFKTPMKYLNEMYLRGLLTKDPFIDAKDVSKAKIEKGDVISYCGAIGDGKAVPADNPDTQFEILPPFESYKEVRTGTGWLATVVPKTCKDPERAILFLEYLASAEGHCDVSWGIQGEEYISVEEGANWHMEDGKPVLLKGYLNDKNADWGGVAARDGLGEYWLACNELLWNLVWWDNSNEEMTKYNEWFGDYIEFDSALDLQNPSPESEEGIIRQKAYNLLQQYSVEMVFTDNFESAYQEFISKVDELGMEKVEAYWTEEYQKKIGE